MDKLIRQYIMIGVDALLTVAAALAAVLLRFEGFPGQLRAAFVPFVLSLVALRLVSFYLLGMYNSVAVCKYRRTGNNHQGRDRRNGGGELCSLRCAAAAHT